MDNTQAQSDNSTPEPDATPHDAAETPNVASSSSPQPLKWKHDKISSHSSKKPYSRPTTPLPHKFGPKFTTDTVLLFRCNWSCGAVHNNLVDMLVHIETFHFSRDKWRSSDHVQSIRSSRGANFDSALQTTQKQSKESFQRAMSKYQAPASTEDTSTDVPERDTAASVNSPVSTSSLLFSVPDNNITESSEIPQTQTEILYLNSPQSIGEAGEAGEGNTFISASDDPDQSPSPQSSNGTGNVDDLDVILESNADAGPDRLSLNERQQLQLLIVKQKRRRRHPDEIFRRFRCSFEKCEKSYGTLSHLNTHVKRTGHGPVRLKEEFRTSKNKLKTILSKPVLSQLQRKYIPNFIQDAKMAKISSRLGIDGVGGTGESEGSVMVTFDPSKVVMPNLQLSSSTATAEALVVSSSPSDAIPSTPTITTPNTAVPDSYSNSSELPSSNTDAS